MSAVAPPEVVTWPVLVDWNLILDDLEHAGVSGYKVASILGLEWSTVQRWRGVKGDIGFGFGRALLALHRHYCGEATTLQRLNEAQKRA